MDKDIPKCRKNDVKLGSKQLKSVFLFLNFDDFSYMTSNRQSSFHEKKKFRFQKNEDPIGILYMCVILYERK